MTRRRRNVIDSLLNDSATPLCVVDSERRIRFCSPGFSAMTGWRPEDVEGIICQPASEPASGLSELLATALCPSHDVMEGATRQVSAVLPGVDGSRQTVTLTQLPIDDADGSVSRILVLLEPAKNAVSEQTLSRDLHAEITALRLEFRKRHADGSFIGRCRSIEFALQQAEVAAASQFGFSISGPPGSGRRHLSRLIHSASQHPEHSFVSLDCRLLLPEQVLENARRIRRLSEEPAAGHQVTGTLLLMEADRCPREVQMWILENLRSELTPVRLAAVSESPLVASPENEWLIADFCQLFQATTIELPALHRRGDDIELLAQHFVEVAHRTLKTSAENVAADVLSELRHYRWPGNVRELKDVITAACQNSFGTSLTCEDLPFAFRAGMEAQQLPPTPNQQGRPLEELLHDFERDVLQKTLAACGNNKAEAARRLGMTRPRFYRRLETLGMADSADD